MGSVFFYSLYPCWHVHYPTTNREQPNMTSEGTRALVTLLQLNFESRKKMDLSLFKGVIFIGKHLFLISKPQTLWAWFAVWDLNNHAHKQSVCQLFSSHRSIRLYALSLTNNSPAWLFHAFSKQDKNTELGSGLRRKEGGLHAALWIAGARVNWRTAPLLSVKNEYLWLLWSERENECERCLLGQEWFI